jgi:hypothetical protein
MAQQDFDANYFHAAGPDVEAEIAQSRARMLEALSRAGALTRRKPPPRIEPVRPIQEKPRSPKKQRSTSPHFRLQQPRRLVQEKMSPMRKPKQQRSTSPHFRRQQPRPSPLRSKGPLSPMRKPKQQRPTSLRSKGPLRKPKSDAGKGKPLNRSGPKKKPSKSADPSRRRVVRVCISISVS